MTNRLIIEKKYPYGIKCLSSKGIEDIGFEIVHSISSVGINRRQPEWNELEKKIDEKCIGKHIWILFGRKIPDEMWLPIQVASISAKGKDVRKEIKMDFCRMTPFDEKLDSRVWKSYYHGAILHIEEGKDSVCQKYNALLEIFDEFAVVVMKEEGNICIEDAVVISGIQKKEIEVAKTLQPLIWNPSPYEKRYINIVDTIEKMKMDSRRDDEIISRLVDEYKIEREDACKLFTILK